MDQTAFTAEALVWETGAYSKKPPSRVHLLATGSVVDKLRRSIKRAMAAKTSAPFIYDAPRANLEDMANDMLDPAEAARLSHGVPDELVVPYLDTLHRCRQAGSNTYPRYEMGGSSATEMAPLSADDVAECWSRLRILISPDRILEEIASWTLTVSQASMFRLVFPEFSSAIDDVIADELVTLVAAKRDIAWQMQDVIGTWKGVPAETAIVTSQSQPPPPSPAPPERTVATNEITPLQAAQSRRQKI